MGSTMDFSLEWNGFCRWYRIVAAWLALPLLLCLSGFDPGRLEVRAGRGGLLR